MSERANTALSFFAGPTLYGLLALATGASLIPLQLPGALPKLFSALIAVMMALFALALSVRRPPTRDQSALWGLVALLAAIVLGRQGHHGPEWLVAPLHASLLLVASAGLGEAFADVVSERLADSSVVFTAALCLALFDVWSVLFGPANNAASGGLLALLLLEAPSPGGWMRFIGISDLVLVVLLVGVGRRRGWGTRSGWLAGMLGIALALGQALITLRAAPALPWIGGCYCLFAWGSVRPGASGWRRTFRWAAGTTVLLAVATGVLRLMHKA